MTPVQERIANSPIGEVMAVLKDGLTESELEKVFKATVEPINSLIDLVNIIEHTRFPDGIHATVRYQTEYERAKEIIARYS